MGTKLYVHTDDSENAYLDGEYDDRQALYDRLYDLLLEGAHSASFEGTRYYPQNTDRGMAAVSRMKHFNLKTRLPNRTTLLLGTFASHALAIEAVEQHVLFLNASHQDNETGWRFSKRMIDLDRYEIIKERSTMQRSFGQGHLPVARQLGGLYEVLIIEEVQS